MILLLLINLKMNIKNYFSLNNLSNIIEIMQFIYLNTYVIHYI